MKEVSVDFDCDDDSSDVSGYHSDSDSVIMMATGNSPFVSKAARANFLTRSGNMFLFVYVNSNFKKRKQYLDLLISNLNYGLALGRNFLSEGSQVY